MSKYSDEFVIEFAAELVMAACCEVAANLGWRVMEQSDLRLVCKEVASQVSSFTSPAKIEIMCVPSTNSSTQVSLKCSNFGYGPIQSGHVKGQVGNIRNRIMVALNNHKTSAQIDYPAPNIAAQIKSLFCTECGAEITAVTKFCAKCGTKVGISELGSPSANSASIPALQSPPLIHAINVQPAKGTKFIKIIGWGIIGWGLAVGVALIFVLPLFGTPNPKDVFIGTPNPKDVFTQYAKTAGWYEAVYDSGKIIKEGYTGAKGSVAGEDKVYLYVFNYHDHGSAQKDYVLVINTKSGKSFMKWGTEQSLLDYMAFSGFHQ